MMMHLKIFPKQILLVILLMSLILFSGCLFFDLRINTTGLPSGTVGVFYDARLYANQWVDSWALVSGSLPPGLSFSSSGRFSGIPTDDGTYSFTVEAIQYGPAGDHAYKGFTITIYP